MKNRFFIWLLLCPFIPLFAQEGEGLRNVVGGQFNYLSIKDADYQYNSVQIYGTKDRRIRNWGVHPYAAWKISRRTLLGFRLGYDNAYDRIPYNNINISTLETFGQTGSVGIFSRHYLKPEARLGLFVEPSLRLSRSETKQRYDGSDYTNNIKDNQASLLASLGVSYYLSPRLGLLVRAGQFGYAFGKTSHPDNKDIHYQTFELDFDLSSFFWGIEWRW